MIKDGKVENEIEKKDKEMHKIVECQMQMR